MKIVVVGSGFTGMLSAVAIKIRCPQHTVVMIDSDREAKNQGFGESAPPHMLKLLFDTFAVPEDKKKQWLIDFLIQTKSTIKFNLKWRNFHDYEDRGYFGGIPDMPSYQAIFEPTHTKKPLPTSVIFPDHEAYKLHDLWYELYLQGRRSREDFEGDINPLYWYSLNHSMVSQMTIGHVEDRYFSLAPTIHINSYTVGDWIRSTYGHLLDEIIVGSVDEIVADDDSSVKSLKLNTQQHVTGDLYLDCTGFRRLFANRFGLQFSPASTTIKHDSCVVVFNGYTKHIDSEMHPYTEGIGMQYGWTFGVPLIDRKSYGYVFDSSFISADQALEELASISNPTTRIGEPIRLKWQSGCYKQGWNQNYLALGLAAGFNDPFDANSIAINFAQINALMPYLTGQAGLAQTRDDYNISNLKFFELIAERVELHFGLAPRNTSEYWQRNHQVAKEKNLAQHLLKVMNRPIHSLASHFSGRGLPYLSHLYLAEAFYYDIDMTSRCRRSEPAELDFAEQYFKSFNELNRMRSELAPSMREWYQSHGINFNDYVRF